MSKTNTKKKALFQLAREWLERHRLVWPLAFFIVAAGLIWTIIVLAAPEILKPLAWARKNGSGNTSSVSLKNDSRSASKIVAESNLVPRRLDGVLVSPDQSNLFPIAIMIDNIPPAWPQSGLEAASVIYETLVEGGATRLMAVFAGGRSQRIGPVRSARPCYLEWVSEYDALYGHVGGSPEALAAISGLGLRDFSQFKNGQYFWRDKNRYAPHNVYTSFELIDRAIRDNNMAELEPTYETWPFKSELPLAERPKKTERIEVRFSGGRTWTSTYQYDYQTNAYAKFQANEPHLDEETGRQLLTKNVVVVLVPKIMSYGEKGRITLDVTGQGRAFVFRDGLKFVGTWKKENRLARTRFYDEVGSEIELNRGTTWISIVPEDREVLYEESDQ